MAGSYSALDIITDASSFSYFIVPQEPSPWSENSTSVNKNLIAAVRQGNLDDVRKIIAEAGEECFKTYVDSYRLVEEAVKYKRVCMLKLLIALGGVVNKATDSPSPLHLACKMGDPCLARYLILAGADVNRRDSNGSFPIHYAVQSNIIKNELSKYGRLHSTHYYRYVSSHLTLLLIENGANFINYLDHSRLSPLHHAVLNGNTNVVSILLEHNASVNLKGSHRRTPLWCAVYAGNKELADMLLEAGASSECTDEVGLTLLHVAVRKNNFDMTWYLLNYFRKNDLLGGIINETSSEGESCLHYAAASLNKDIMGALISFGASVNLYNFDCSSPLIAACSGHNPEEYLPPIQYSRRPFWFVNPAQPSSSTNKDGSHTCDYCTAISYLIKKGAKVNESNNRGETPLHIAAKCNLLCVAKLLLDHGAIVDERDDDGLTPLHLSVEHQCLDMIALLLDRGADPDAKGEEYLTPLHLAAIRAEESSEKTVKLISLLLEFDADVNAKNIVDLTPLFLVLRNAFDGQYSPTTSPQIIDILLMNGADVFAKSSSGRTPFSIAASRYFSGLLTDFHSESFQQMLFNVCLHGVKMVAAFPLMLEKSSSTETTTLMLDLLKEEFYRLCLVEVESLKNSYVLPDTPYYDLLSLNISKFSKRLRNREFEEILRNGSYINTFPTYGPIIQSKFCKAVKRKDDMARGQHFFACLSDYLNYPRLPLICVEFVLKHLRISDFKSINKILNSSN